MTSTETQSFKSIAGLMKNIATKFLVAESAVMAIVLLVLLINVTANYSSFLPYPVMWFLIVPAALGTLAGLIELVRRKLGDS